MMLSRMKISRKMMAVAGYDADKIRVQRDFVGDRVCLVCRMRKKFKLFP